ncbi:hypothetical protein [[Clostridium] scindens]|uniref:hypothetical protein n=1 Tax=Clostridium scindens (strain JCM 10418 / VPI 12708) TaxID=29347 RepID=UPI0039949CCE
MKRIDRRQIQTISHYRQKSRPPNRTPGSQCENCHNVTELRLSFLLSGRFSMLFQVSLPAAPLRNLGMDKYK